MRFLREAENPVINRKPGCRSVWNRQSGFVYRRNFRQSAQVRKNRCFLINGQGKNGMKAIKYQIWKRSLSGDSVYFAPKYIKTAFVFYKIHSLQLWMRIV